MKTHYTLHFSNFLCVWLTGAVRILSTNINLLCVTWNLSSGCGVRENFTWIRRKVIGQVNHIIRRRSWLGRKAFLRESHARYPNKSGSFETRSIVGGAAALASSHWIDHSVSRHNALAPLASRVLASRSVGGQRRINDTAGTRVGEHTFRASVSENWKCACF